MPKIFAWVLFCALVLMTVFMYNQTKNQKIEKTRSENRITHVLVKGVEVEVDLAISQSEKSKGLGGRDALAEREGMLFVFDQIGKYPFWMKGMNFPIDIIWIDKEGVVVEVVENLAPGTYPALFGGEALAKYVLEVNAGFSQMHGVEVGTSVEFIRN